MFGEASLGGKTLQKNEDMMITKVKTRRDSQLQEPGDVDLSICKADLQVFASELFFKLYNIFDALYFKQLYRGITYIQQTILFKVYSLAHFDTRDIYP